MSTTALAPHRVPRRRAVPVLGPTLAYVADPLALMRDQHDRFGPVSEMPFLGRRWTVLTGPDACAEALRNPDKAFSNELGWDYLVGPFFHRGLMLLDFEEHHRHRRLMQEAFTRDRLHGYIERLGPAVARGLDDWTPGPAVQVYPALKQLTLDLATQIFMGGADLDEPGEIDRVNRAFIDCVQAATGFVRAPVPGTRWGRATKGRALLEEFLGRQVADRRASGGDDLFSVLTRLTDDEGASFSDEDVVNHMIFLLMAAHDTSTITVSTMMRFLGQHPDWQDRCREESMMLPAHPDFDTLGRLTSLDLVMKESLRLVPPVPVLARRTVKDTEILGVPIPAGRLTAVMVHLQHHMPEYWTEPERFDPDRFSDERREDKVHRHAWEPFGGGVHKCLGMHFAGAEVRTIMHQLLRRFRWTVPADYSTPLNYGSLPFPDDGQPVDLRPLAGQHHRGAR
ncbi:MAG: cytochrome P450 [Aeromicrobium sp.]|uniref:cytochrome P450 n=1 Tax=Aeromicrobium sp. TaxID=1871063 RepID=UPI00261A506E|nr:cytochrome P450 [Aeromicrobium sp.]MDF1705683.1 cytochrome P450 [Aeromicrobium sp.]